MSNIPPRGGKRSAIRPFEARIKVDPSFFEKTWSILSNAIQQIYDRNASGLSFEELYRASYNLILHKCGEQLYKETREILKARLFQLAQSASQTLDAECGLIKVINKAYQDHCVSMHMIRDILMYMDRVYVMQEHIPSIHNLGLILFREHVIRAESIFRRLINAVLNEIQRDRNGESIDRTMLRNCIYMFYDLRVNKEEFYHEEFEKRMLQETRIFYQKESRQYLDVSKSSVDYLKKAEQWLSQEQERVCGASGYIYPASEPALRRLIEQEVIAEHVEELTTMESSGVVVMMKHNKLEDLERCFRLFSRVPSGRPTLLRAVDAFLRLAGDDLFETYTTGPAQRDPLAYIQALLDLHIKHTTFLDQCFHRETEFKRGLDTAFEYIINKSNKSPEAISLFIDERLRKGVKGLEDTDIEAVLDKVMVLFRYIQDKDIFEKYYKNHLAKRLLTLKTVNDDSETAMLSKLRVECGQQFTSKLEGMFKDIKLSETLQLEFAQFLRQNLELQRNVSPLDLSVKVLTAGYWPGDKNITCEIPSLLLPACNVFKEFYLSSRSGRKLTWMTNLGNAEISTTFNSQKRDLLVTTHMMVVLLQFQLNDEQSFANLLENTKIPEKELKRVLQSLSCAKYKILLKHPKSKEVDVKDTFTFNVDFTAKLYRIKIMTVKDVETESHDTRQKVDEDRKHLIEAAIVRIMKARKTLSHANLVAEVTQQLSARFMPSPPLIKARIESLIERDYLERHASDRKIYNYLA